MTYFSRSKHFFFQNVFQIFNSIPILYFLILHDLYITFSCLHATVLYIVYSALEVYVIEHIDRGDFTVNYFQEICENRQQK